MATCYASHTKFLTGSCIALEAYNPQIQTDLAIFALDYSAIMDTSITYIKAKDEAFNESIVSIHEKQDTVFDNVVDRFTYDIAWVAEPNQLNSRLDRQAGSFLLSGNRGLRIHDVLDSQLYSNFDLYKFII